jgi:hypothetical protein
MPLGCQRLLRDFDIATPPWSLRHRPPLRPGPGPVSRTGEPITAAQPDAAPVGAHSSALQTGALGYPSPSPTTIAQGVVHITHQPHSSLGAPICRSLMVEFTLTLFKPMGDPKPNGCERGCDFSPMGVAMGGFGRVLRVWP